MQHNVCKAVKKEANEEAVYVLMFELMWAVSQTHISFNLFRVIYCPSTDSTLV